MTDASLCSAMLVGPPEISVASLVELSRFLQSLPDVPVETAHKDTGGTDDDESSEGGADSPTTHAEAIPGGRTGGAQHAESERPDRANRDTDRGLAAGDTGSNNGDES